MREVFWLVDVSAEQVNGLDEVWIWGVTRDGKRCIFRCLNQKQRFYVVVGSDADLDRALSIVRDLPGVVECKPVVKRSFGDERKAVEVSCIPSKADDVIKAVKSRVFNGELFEDDIRLSNRFLLDNDISPSSWYEAEVEDSDVMFRDGIDKVYVLKSIRRVETASNPNLRIVGVDFIYYSDKGSPKPDRSPIVAISIAKSNGENIQFSGGEYEVLKSFIDVIKAFDPDVIVGFKLNVFHWSFLLKRCGRYGLKLEVGKIGYEPHQSLYGHFSVAGRVNFDLKEYADEIAELERGTIEELAEYLGFRVDVKPVDEFYHSEYWADDGRRSILLKYSMWRAKTYLDVFNIISDYVFSLSAITGIPADHVFTAAAGFRLENFLMREAVKHGELIPKVKGKVFPSYPGGKVLTPRMGLHEGIAVVDFKAMYPSLMLKYNISPDTVKPLPCVGFKNVIKVEDANTCIVQDRKGFFTHILETAVRERERVRMEMSKYPKDSVEYRFLDSAQRILKVLANAMYGYMGWIGARWYLKEGAETVASLGRKVISETIRKASELGLEIIYGDTDSIFIKYDEGRIGKLLEWINKDLGLEAKIDKVYSRVVFTEAKKKYAGIASDGVLDIVGLEAVRGDWCRYAKETQKALVEKLLKGESRSRLIDFVRDRVAKLRSGQVDLESLIIWRQLAKRLEEYEVNAPHVVVAYSLKEDGWILDRGDYIGFVVTRGAGPIYTRAKHYSKTSVSEADLEYYVEKQLIPVCSRILEAVGVREKDLEKLIKSAGRGLESFF